MFSYTALTVWGCFYKDSHLIHSQKKQEDSHEPIHSLWRLIAYITHGLNVETVVKTVRGPFLEDSQLADCRICLFWKHAASVIYTVAPKDFALKIWDPTSNFKTILKILK